MPSTAGSAPSGRPSSSPSHSKQKDRAVWRRCASSASRWTPAKSISSSSQEPTRSTTRRPTCASPSACKRSGSASTSGSTTTRPPISATGTFPRRTTSKPGATRAPTTERSRSCSRCWRRSTTESRPTSWSPRWPAKPDATGYDIVRAHWQDRLPAPFEKSWRKVLHDGVVADTDLVAMQPNWISPPGTQLLERRATETEGFQVVFRPDPSTYDGRFANNGWLQELPRPITRLTWDNAAWIAPATAERLGLGNGDVVELSSDDRYACERRYGSCPARRPSRSRCTSATDGRGPGTWPLPRVSTPIRSAPPTSRGRSTGSRCARPAKPTPWPAPRITFSMEGRDLVRVRNVGETDDRHDDAHHGNAEQHEDNRSTRRCPTRATPGACRSTSAPASAATPAWSPVSRRTTSRSSARNRSTVGREMHWLRIDRYFAGDLDAPEIVQQPVPCMHCEQRAVRARLPGQRHRAQRRGAERHGVQPLRRHALLLEQLPLQGAALQLLPLQRRAVGRARRWPPIRTSPCAAAA